MNDIENKVLRYIESASFRGEPSLDEPFTDFGLDSLDEIDLLMQIEKDFKIKIPNKSFFKMKNGRDIVNYIQKVSN